jgi:hypothetical protein
MSEAFYGLPGPVAQPVAGPAQRPAAPVNLAALLQKIEEAIDDETSSIRSDVDFDIKASNARKSRHLYDLTRAIRACSGAVPAQFEEPLIRLRSKLARNEAAIRAHMDAVGEVAGLIQEAIRRSEADGTYSSAEFGGNGAP